MTVAENDPSSRNSSITISEPNGATITDAILQMPDTSPPIYGQIATATWRLLTESSLKTPITKERLFDPYPFDSRNSRYYIAKARQILDDHKIRVVTIDDPEIKRHFETRSSAYAVADTLPARELAQQAHFNPFTTIEVQTLTTKPQTAYANRKPDQSPIAEPTIAIGSERDVVDRAKSGDLEAVGTLYELYSLPIFRYVVGRVGDATDAEDITADVFVRVHQYIDRFTWQEGIPFSAWIYAIARNQVNSHHRKTHHKTTISTDDVEIVTPDNALAYTIRQSERAEVYRAISLLPKGQQDVIALRFGADQSVLETAQILGKTQNNIKVMQHKAIARLQSILGDSAHEQTSTHERAAMRLSKLEYKSTWRTYELASILGVSRSFIIKLHRQRRIKGTQVGNYTVYDSSEITRYFLQFVQT